MILTEIQNKLWSDLPEEKREQFRSMFEDEKTNKSYLKALQDCFGEHNLAPRSPIEVWTDFESNEDYEEIDSAFVEFEEFLNTYISGSANYKLLATYQINELIEHGYGGRVTSKEWRDESLDKFVIVPEKDGQRDVTFVVRAVKHMDANHFIAFHTKEQAKKFIAFPSNIQLARYYYML